MPYKAKTHCERQIEKRGRPPETRPKTGQRGYGWQWQKARKTYLDAHPLCVVCMKEGRTTGATVVDHVVDHKGNYQLMWNENNWQALCATCHNRKTGMLRDGHR